MARTTSFGTPQRAGSKAATYLRANKTSHKMSNRDLAEIIGVDEKVIRLAKDRLGIPQKERGSGQPNSTLVKKPNAKRRKFTAVIQAEGAGFVSFCPELDIASQGESPVEASDNLKEALELFFECASPTEVQKRLKACKAQLTRIEVAVG
jgi:predicted RNase H-like HicB family nuclease